MSPHAATDSPATDSPAADPPAAEALDSVERSWTPVGTLDAGVLADVDTAGSVRMAGASWSLDWWIGAEDRWHRPSREVAVRQQCLASSPIVETAMRIPGGDVLCRTYGVVASAGDWKGPAVTVEVENLSSVPVALAFVVRPLNLDGAGNVRSVRSIGPVVEVDGTPRLLLSRDPARVLSGPLDSVVGRLASGDDAAGPLDATSAAGDLEAAFVVPLTHTAVARVLLPCTDPSDRRGPRPGAPWTSPDVESVTSGWAAHGGDLWTSGPEPEWDGSLRWADCMLRLAGPDEVGGGLDRKRPGPAGPSAAVRAAEVAEAMTRFGAADALAPIARGLAGAQRLGGAVRMGDRSDATVALLHAAAGAMAGSSPEGVVVESLLAPTAVAIRRVRRGRGVEPGTRDSAVRALSFLAPVLERIGQPEVAQDARSAAVAVGARYDGGVDRAAGVPTDGSVGGTVGGTVRSTFGTALAVRCAVAGRSPDAVAGLRSLWSGASWRGRSDAERVDPGGGSAVAVGSLGFDVAELAARTNALLDMYVTVASASPDGPGLMSVFDPAWVGRSIEAHDVPTPWGPVGYAVRWHGRRPAVLWEIGGAEDVVVTAPGLDGGWAGRGAEGEALLGEIPVPETAVLINLGGQGSSMSTSGGAS